MKKSEIQVGGLYRAKVNNYITTVKVNDIVEETRYAGRNGTYYHVTNLASGRNTTFRSAMKFRSKVEPPKVTIPEPPVNQPVVEEKPAVNGLAQRVTEQYAAQTQIGTEPHLIVEALAGTGKTTTLIQALRRLKGHATTIEPSPQQQAVWNEIDKSHGARSICFCAFNVSIANELKNKVPQGVDACTMHSLGNKAVCKRFGKLRIPNDAKWVVRERIARVMGQDLRELMKKDYDMIESIRKLVGLCKQNLVGHGWTNEVTEQYGESASYTLEERWEEELDKLCAHYEVDLNGSRTTVFRLVPQVLELCKTPNLDGTMDFDDMIWLPVVLNLSMWKNDLLLVDEAQDLNRCQQALARKAGKRLVLCGDKHQAIYGFAGADSESLPRMEQELGATQEGCVVLPLTVTRRCGKAIVAEAQKIVSNFEAHESNSDGTVLRASFVAKASAVATDDMCPPVESYVEQLKGGDAVLCRVNAPLVSQCFRCIAKGMKANIQGRDIGQGLVSTIKKMKANDIADLSGKLSDWLHLECEKENRKRNPSEARLIGLQDRFDCLMVFVDNADSVENVIKKIEELFTDNTTTGIKFSSIHRAKGLEWQRVFFLMPKGGECPHPMAKSAWQKGQETNLLYVGITRAINELVYVR